MKRFLLISFLYFASMLTLSSQTDNGNVRVYVDCSNLWCDFDYMKTEITFVDFVRDRFSANVYILLTSQNTGSGQGEIKFIFLGQEAFKGNNDTLSYLKSINETDDVFRQAMTQILKIGLLPYCAKAGKTQNFQITYSDKKDDGDVTLRKESEIKDPWNYWVFRVGCNGNGSGDRTYKSFYYSGRITASRVTEKMKLNIGTNGSVNSNIYEYDVDGETKREETKSEYYRSYINYVHSISKHFSAGAFLSYAKDNYNNFNHQITVQPGIEYNVYPYSKSNQKLWSFQYKIGIVQNSYVDTSLYDKTAEYLPSHSLGTNIKFIQKWGSIYTGIQYRSYLHDLDFNNIGVNLSLDANVFKGLSVSVGSSYNSIHDQINLRKGASTEVDILIRRHEIASSYDFFFFFSLNYTFGSMYSNVVNPRFDSSGGMYFYSN